MGNVLHEKLTAILNDLIRRTTLFAQDEGELADDEPERVADSIIDLLNKRCEEEGWEYPTEQLGKDGINHWSTRPASIEEVIGGGSS